MLALASLASGCYAGTSIAISPREVAADPGWQVVTGVPLIRQRGPNDCGAAALAMVLSYWVGPTTIAGLTAGAPASAAHGWRAADLRDAARARGLRAFVVNGQLADLTTEVAAGRPVVVGLVQRAGDRTRAHYEVIVGIHRAKRLILSLDPAAGWREDSFEGFAREWIPAERATLVLLPAATNPAPSRAAPPFAPGAVAPS